MNFSFKLSKNYAISGVIMGINWYPHNFCILTLDGSVQLTGHHSPGFRIEVTVLGVTFIELSIYNVNHAFDA